MRENPENKGFTNGKYYYYQTTNGNWDIGPGIDKAKQTDAFNIKLELIEKRYRDQYTRLDTLLSSLQNTSSYLAQQIQSISNNS